MKKEASERYYKNTSSFRLACYHGEETIGMIIVDGVYTDDYKSIHKVVYKGPEIIDKSFCFYGVDIEYVTREKILAISF